MTLTTLKEEARAEFADHFLYHPAGVWRDGKILKPDFRPLTFDNVNKFLDSLIDRTYHATKEEVELSIRDSEQNRLFAVMRALGIPHDAKAIMAKRKEWEIAALEDTATSPNL